MPKTRGAEREKRSERLEKKIDKIDQQKKECNIIISGPALTKTTREVRTFLNEQLDCDTTPTDIN